MAQGEYVTMYNVTRNRWGVRETTCKYYIVERFSKYFGNGCDGSVGVFDLRGASFVAGILSVNHV